MLRRARAGRPGAGRNDVIEGNALAARRRRPNRRALAAVAAAILVVVGAVVGLRIAGGSGSSHDLTLVSTGGEVGAAGDATPTTTVRPTTAAPTTTRPPRDLGRLVLVGDSVALTLADAFGAEARARGLRYTATAIPGCGMVTGLPSAGPGAEPVSWAAGCEPLLLKNEQGLAVRKDAGTVIWLSTWETSDRWIGGTLHEFGTPETDLLLLDLMEQARARLLDGSDAMLVLVKVAPNAATSAVGDADEENVRRMVHLNELLGRFADSHPVDTRVMDLAAIVCPGGPPCPAVVDGLTPRPKDGDHFSPEGAAWLAPQFLDALVATAG